MRWVLFVCLLAGFIWLGFLNFLLGVHGGDQRIMERLGGAWNYDV